MSLLKLARITLYFFALSFLALGTLHLVTPTALTAMVEVALPTPIALMEVRGVYGGFFLGIGLLFFLCARHGPWLQSGLVALATTMGGLVVGRTVGLLVDGPATPFIYTLLASEVAGLVIALAALRRLSQRRADEA